MFRRLDNFPRPYVLTRFSRQWSTKVCVRNSAPSATSPGKKRSRSPGSPAPNRQRSAKKAIPWSFPASPAEFDDIVNSVASLSKNVKVPGRQIATTSTSCGRRQRTLAAELGQNLTALDRTLRTANATLQSLTHTYGDDLDFQRNLAQLMNEANDALRSIRLLAAYLNLHPQALLSGEATNETRPIDPRHRRLHGDRAPGFLHRAACDILPVGK